MAVWVQITEEWRRDIKAWWSDVSTSEQRRSGAEAAKSGAEAAKKRPKKLRKNKKRKKDVLARPATDQRVRYLVNQQKGSATEGVEQPKESVAAAAHTRARASYYAIIGMRLMFTF